MSKITSKFLVTRINRYDGRGQYHDHNARNNKTAKPRRPFIPLYDMKPGDSVNVIFANDEAEFEKKHPSYMSYLAATSVMTGIKLKKKKYFFPGHVHEYGITVTHDGFYEME